MGILIVLLFVAVLAGCVWLDGPILYALGAGWVSHVLQRLTLELLTDPATERLLARASDDAQRARLGDQTGGRVGFFLETDDFARDHAAMRARGVEFLEEPRHEAYATVAVFRDLYGNRWDLLEPKR